MFQISQNPSLRFSMIDVAGVKGANPDGSCAIYTKHLPQIRRKKESADLRRRFAFLAEGCCLCNRIRDPHMLDRTRPRSRASRQNRSHHRRSNQMGKRHLSKAQTHMIHRHCWRKGCSFQPWHPCILRRCKSRLPPCSPRRSCPHQGTCTRWRRMNRRRCSPQGCSSPQRGWCNR